MLMLRVNPKLGTSFFLLQFSDVKQGTESLIFRLLYLLNVREGTALFMCGLFYRCTAKDSLIYFKIYEKKTFFFMYGFYFFTDDYPREISPGV